MNRRQFIQITSAGMAGAALVGIAGCGGGGESGGSGSFNVAMGQDTTGTLPTLIKRFNKEYKGEYKATLGEYPTASDQYFDKLRTQFQAGGEGLDAVGGDVIWPAQFAANGFIADISDRFPESERAKFLQGPIEANTYDGQIFGVPWFTDGGLLYYRSDLLEKSGFSEPPATWDELKEQAKKVMQDQGTKYGFVWQGADYEGGVCNGLEYIYSFGGAILDEDDASQVLIGSPEAADGLAMARSMITEGVSPQAVTTFTEVEADPAFLNGTSVFERCWPYVYGNAADPEQSNIEQSQVGIAPLPAGPAGSVSTLGGWNYFLSATSQNPDAAYEWIKFATSEEQQRWRATAGSFLPTVNSLYEDQSFLEEAPLAAFAKQALQNTVPRPVSPYYWDMSLELAEQFNAAFTGEVPPEQAVNTLESGLKDIVEQAS